MYIKLHHNTGYWELLQVSSMDCLHKHSLI